MAKAESMRIAKSRFLILMYQDWLQQIIRDSELSDAEQEKNQLAKFNLLVNTTPEQGRQVEGFSCFFFFFFFYVDNGTSM